MQNLFLLATDKPSRLFIDVDNNKLTITNNPIGGEYMMNQNIYIISDEEIKEGDWYLVELFKITAESDNFHIEKCTKLDDVWCNNFDVLSARHKDNCKKIILTTDQDLIADGIEQISEDTLLKIIEHINSGKNIESFGEL